jgi:hypothetical protein
MWLPRRPGKVFGKAIELRLRRREAQHAVLAAGDEQRRLADRLAAPRAAQLPVAPQVAVPVQAAAEAGAAKFAGVIVEIGLGEPRRQLRRIDGVAEQRAGGEPGKALALLVELAARRVVDRRSAARMSCCSSASGTPGFWKYCR